MGAHRLVYMREHVDRKNRREEIGIREQLIEYHWG